MAILVEQGDLEAKRLAKPTLRLVVSLRSGMLNVGCILGFDPKEIWGLMKAVTISLTCKGFQVLYLCDLVDSSGYPRAIADQARTIRILFTWWETINLSWFVSSVSLQEVGQRSTPESLSMGMTPDKVQ